MGQLLIDVIFSVLNFIGNLFLGPIFSAISALVPSLSIYFSHFLTFIDYGLNYVDFFIKLLMIPTPLIIAFISFFVGIFTFNLTIRVVGLGMSIYNYFKP